MLITNIEKRHTPRLSVYIFGHNPKASVCVFHNGLKILSVWLLICWFGISATAQASRPDSDQSSHSLIIDPIDQSDIVRLPNTTPRAVKKAFDHGRLAPNTKLQDLILVLKSSPEQEHALAALLDAQQDKKSANYHHWLTADDFGRLFGLPPTDLQKIRDWLTQQGFTIEDIGHGHTNIVFSATAAQIEKTFHTELRHYIVDGEQHFSNSADISIPTALQPVIASVALLNDFHPKPTHTVRANNEPLASGIVPTFTLGQGHSLSPSDFAIIYKTQPLLLQNYDGTGVKVGIISLSNVNPQDIQNFRDIFFPGRPANAPALFTPGGDPGKDGKALEREADLDLEWAGAVAPGATIVNFASSSLEIAARYAVETNFVDIISMSFSFCEQPASDLFQALWAQAAAEGITVFVSAGDSGAADCDSDDAAASVNGYAVNRLASTPFNVAVGGTEFAENGNDARYWSASNGQDLASALGYIPEVTWSESCFNNTVIGNGLDCDAGPGLWSAGGGVSILYRRPSWQSGPGVPADDPITVSNVVPGPHRYIPDVSLSASGHDGYRVCTEVQQPSGLPKGDCSDGTPATAAIVLGTSAATPAFAGIQAIIDQKYGRQGQAAYVYYNLAAKQNTAICNSTGTTAPDSSCIFNDITTGSNGVPCVVGVSDTSCPVSRVLAHFGASAGYDLATGLGSVDATNLFSQWHTATLRSISVVLGVINPASRIASVNQPVTMAASLSVPDGAWGPPPTGSVTFFDGSTQLGSVKPNLDLSSLDYQATFTATFSTSGEHIIKAQYIDNSGGGYLGSISPPVSIFVQQPATLPSLLNLSSTPATISGGQSAIINATLDGPAPAGGAIVVLSTSDAATFPVPSSLTVLPGQTAGSSTGIVVGNPTLATNVTIKGSYNGTTKTATVIVNPTSKVSFSITLTASQASAVPGQTVSLTAVASGANGPAPTGLLFFRDVFNGVATLICSQPLVASATTGQYTSTCSEQLLTTGLHAVVAIYDGDVNYGSSISNVASITVQQQSSGPVLAGFSIMPATITGGLPAQGAISLTGPAPANATITFDSNNSQFVPVPPPVAVTQGFNSRAFPIQTNFTSGIVGATLTAHYNGTVAGASITVMPVAVSGVTFFPSTVTAGTPAVFTVFLTGPAPAGTLVSLTSSNPAVLQVPATVALDAGANSVSITGTTSAVASQATVTLTASYNLSSSQTSLVVTPAPPLTLNSFGVSPQTVTGGSPATGNVGLTAPAPAGGVSVTISSSNTLIASGTVKVPAGNIFAPFSLTTSTVTAITNVVLTASFGGVSQTVTVTLVPPLPFVASLTFTPSTVNSGTSATGIVTLTAPAPLGGVSPLLMSTTQAGIAIVPFNVNIPFGSTSASFVVPTAPIGFIAQLPVAVSFNGTSATSTLTIVPPGTPMAPAAVAFDPSQITGGTPSIGTIVLTGLAPSGGALVFITSDSNAVTVPPSVTVPAGADRISFTINSSAVPVLSTATVKATLNGVSQSSLLTLVPAKPEPQLNPVPFLINPVAPLTQTPAMNGSTLTVIGSGFVEGAQVFWDRTALSTTFVSAAKLQAPIPRSNINESAVVSVKNPGPISLASNTLAAHLGFTRKNLSFRNALLATGNLPEAVVTADLNGDNNLDVVIGRDQGVSVFLGNGDGTFGPELILPAAALSVTVADFNGDGKPDIAAISSTSVNSSLRIFLGNGDGTFSRLEDMPLGGVAGIGSLAVGDVNGDGNLDLVIANSDFPQALLLIGNGDGTFRTPVAVSNINFPLDVALADLNGDGKLDLILTDIQNTSIAVLLGNGDGTFQTQKEYTTNGNVVALTVADFNGDGHPDIAVSNEGPVGGPGGGAGVLLNNGDGTFSAPTIYAPGQEFFGIACDDIDGDGNLDLVLMAGIGVQHTASIFLGKGDGTFATSPVVIPLGSSTSFLRVADINNDGAPDFLITNAVNNGGITLLMQATGPILHVAPESLFFTATQGGSSPPPQSIVISNTGDGQQQWSITASQPWVIISPSQGSEPGSVDIGVNPTGLAVGTYTATLTTAAVGSANSPVAVQISLAVNSRAVVIDSVTFNSSNINGAGTVMGTVTLSSPAQSTANVALLSNSSSLQVPATIAVVPGSSSATFSATSSNVSNQTTVTVTATYNGISTSAALTLNPVPPDFSLVTAPGTSTSQTVTAGQSATYNLQVNPQNGFAGEVNFACSVTPAGPTCSVNPTAANISGSAVSVAVTASTTPRATTGSVVSDITPRHILVAGWVIAMLGSLMIFKYFQKRRWPAVSVAVFLVAVFIPLLSCGGHGSNNPQTGTPAGAYTISVVGTSGATSRNIVLSLTVQ